MAKDEYATGKQDRRSIGVTWRALILDILLVPVNVYWIMDSTGQGYPTTVSLYFNVIFCVSYTPHPFLELLVFNEIRYNRMNTKYL